jgi:hypothetical protein
METAAGFLAFARYPDHGAPLVKHLLTITTGLLAFAILAGCDNPRPASTTTQTKISDGKTEHKIKTDPGNPGVDADTKARKEAEKTKVKAKLDGIDANIKVLQDHAAKETGDKKKAIDDEVKDLQKKRDDLQKQSDKIDTTEASTWDNFVTEMNKAADSVSDAAKQAAGKVRK